jgi:hypothetical protein
LLREQPELLLIGMDAAGDKLRVLHSLTTDAGIGPTRRMTA